jgi:hypothetical protein
MVYLTRLARKLYEDLKIEQINIRQIEQELEDLEEENEQQSELSYAVQRERREWISLDIARTAREQWDDTGQEEDPEFTITANSPGSGSEGVRSLETMIDTDEDRGVRNADEVERLLQDCYSLDVDFGYIREEDDRPIRVKFRVSVYDIDKLKRAVEFYSHQLDPVSHPGEEEVGE